MDQGIIKCFKSYYRKILIRKLITDFKAKKEVHLNKLNILEAILMSNSAWNELRSEVISNCFTKAGFLEENTDNSESNTNVINKESNVNSEETDLWNEVCNTFGTNDLSFDDFINADNELVTSETLDLDQIKQMSFKSNTETIQFSDIEDDSEETIELKNGNFNDALTALSTIKSYFLLNENLVDNLSLIDKIEDIMYKNHLNSLKQSKITDFFK